MRALPRLSLPFRGSRHGRDRPPAGCEIGVAWVARVWSGVDDALAVRRRRSAACACELVWESGVGAFAGTPDCCLCARGTASLVNARPPRTAIIVDLIYGRRSDGADR
jgi:hypothetical protein